MLKKTGHRSGRPEEFVYVRAAGYKAARQGKCMGILFRQPAEEYSLDEVYQSKNVMKCDTYYWCNPKWYDMFLRKKKPYINGVI